MDTQLSVTLFRLDRAQRYLDQAHRGARYLAERVRITGDGRAVCQRSVRLLTAAALEGIANMLYALPGDDADGKRAGFLEALRTLGRMAQDATRGAGGAV